MKTNHQRNFKQKYQLVTLPALKDEALRQEMVKDFYIKKNNDDFSNKALFAFTAETSQGGAR